VSHILIVEDDSDIAEAMQFLLEIEGYEVRVEERAEYSVLFEHAFPDLIILDVFVSGTDGRSLCKQIKTQPSTKEIPVLMVSAHPAIEETVRQCGADDFLAKPFDIDVLLEKIVHFTKE
jgi:DNA-binding response OmpR family regulator